MGSLFSYLLEQFPCYDLLRWNCLLALRPKLGTYAHNLGFCNSATTLATGSACRDGEGESYRGQDSRIHSQVICWIQVPSSQCLVTRKQWWLNESFSARRNGAQSATHAEWPSVKNCTNCTKRSPLFWGRFLSKEGRKHVSSSSPQPKIFPWNLAPLASSTHLWSSNTACSVLQKHPWLLTPTSALFCFFLGGGGQLFILCIQQRRI